MAIPDFQTLMLPVLKLAADGEVSIKDGVGDIARQFSLTDDERTKLLPSGRQAVLVNRIAWAKAYLSKAGLIESTRRGAYQLTDEGRRVLASGLTKINIEFLRQFESFRAFRDEKTTVAEEVNSDVVDRERAQTPEERIIAAYREIEEQLKGELLQRIVAAPPAFFEGLILDVLHAIGYGGGRRDALTKIGGSGDGGVDGVINEDILGLNVIYVQAKRYHPDASIGEDKIREFSGALTLRGAAKGIFVTTGYFTKAASMAAMTIRPQKIVLIDGSKFAQLMINHDVGVRVDRTVSIKKIDLDTFEGDDVTP